MAPPTGASVDPYCGDLEARFQNFPSEPNDSRIRKTWGEKWNAARFGQVPTVDNHRTMETSNFVVHPDYLHKYGTLSNGALTKGIKYAETWLYGTVSGARCTQRPSLFLYPGTVHPRPMMVNRGNHQSWTGPIFGLPVTNGSSSDRNGSVIPTFSRKQGDRWLDENPLKWHRCEPCPPAKKSGDERNATWKTKAPCKSGRSSSRDSVSGRDTASAISDPYNLMRKKRLGSIEMAETSTFGRSELRSRKRNASVSPMRVREIRSPTNFDSFKSALSEKEIKLWKSRNEVWIGGDEEEAEEVAKRKSILECELNAYELNKSKSKDEDDFGEELTLNDDSANESKTIRPKFNKTEYRVDSQSEMDGERSQVEKAGKCEPRSSLQRFKMFDRSHFSTPALEEWVSDDEDRGGGSLPKPVSPKRPPRRPKEKSPDESGFVKMSKSKSKSSPNLSIKSILKKRTGSDQVGLSKDSEGETSFQVAPSPVHQEKTRSKQFGQSGKNQVRSTLKKKKQVQFRVYNSNEFLDEARPTSPDSAKSDETFGDAGKNRKPKEESIISEIIAKDSQTNEATECHDAKMAADDVGKVSSRSQEKTQDRSESKLKRSNSDRRFASDANLHKNDSRSPSGTPENLFNDTMALRTRGIKLDAREVFDKRNPDRNVELARKGRDANCEKSSSHQSETVEKLAGNVISYAEFAKLTGNTGGKKPIHVNPCESASAKKSKASIKSHAPTKTKSPAPSPPLRVSPNDKSPTTACAPSPDGTGKENEKETLKPVEAGIPVGIESRESRTSSLTAADKRTVVKLGPSFAGDELSAGDKRKATSVVVSSGSMVERSTEESRQRKTSVVVSTFHPRDSNKVTINVRSEPSEPEVNSSTCTIIETGSNSTVIPVVSTDNKTTLIVGSNSSPSPKIEINGIEPPSSSSPFPHRRGNTSTSGAGHSRCVFSTADTDLDVGIESLDPVEAVRRNLIPHICGKDGVGSTTVEKVGEHRENDSDGGKLEGAEKGEVTSAIANGADTDGDTEERDKLECECEIRNGIEVSETVYETVPEEPIYHEIGSNESPEDVPPPLPLTLPPTHDSESEKHRSRSMFEGASKYEILNYLVDAKERVRADSYLSGNAIGEDAESKRSSSSEVCDRTYPTGDVADCRTPANFAKISDLDSSGRMSLASYPSEDSLTTAEKDTSKSGAKKSSVEVERNDSGVGSETSHASRSKWQASSSVKKDPQHLCEDCDDIVETQVTDGGVRYAPLACRKCAKKRTERKEIIQEIVETEEKYGRDLKIILEEFYTPMLVAGLLTSDQLSSIFLNTDELLEHSRFLTERLRDALEIALEQGDEDLLTVNVGKLFLESEAMLHAFESYCTRQGAAALLLANLEKEKELLRIFLRVSQMENAVLRRMNLNSFLMVPVQRVTKYPLLLARLYKVTLPQQEGRELLKEARHNIELHLEHMNSEAKDVSATKVWRRFSTSTVAGRKSATELEMTNIKLRKMAVDALEWNHEEVRFVLEGKLLYTQPTDSNWKRGRSIKLTPVFVLLVTLGKPNSKYRVDPGEEELTFPSKTGIREATLLLVKEKCGRYTLTREPLYLDKIIVCCETDIDEYFEVQELSTKDSFLFKAADGEKTKEWYKQLQYHAQILGSWRKRRNALANIMINGMTTRACN